MSLIYWDTMLFIYWFEEDSRYIERVHTILTSMRQRKDTLCTSLFTVGEILVVPYKKGADETASRIAKRCARPSCGSFLLRTIQWTATQEFALTLAFLPPMPSTSRAPLKPTSTSFLPTTAGLPGRSFQASSL